MGLTTDQKIVGKLLCKASLSEPQHLVAVDLITRNTHDIVDRVLLLCDADDDGQVDVKTLNLVKYKVLQILGEAAACQALVLYMLNLRGIMALLATSAAAAADYP